MALAKRFFVGNLALNVTKEDLSRHFGLDQSPYLRSSCWVEMAVERSGKSMGFGFVNIPEHMIDDLMKLNGSHLYDKKIRIEPAKEKTENQDIKPPAQEDPVAQVSSTTASPPEKTGKSPRRKQIASSPGGARPQRPSYTPAYSNVIVPSGEFYQLVDVAVNLTNQSFAEDLEHVISRALSTGIHRMVITGNSLKFSRMAISIAKTRPDVLYAAVGVHPHSSEKGWNDATLSTLKDLVRVHEVVAVGEIGLDFNRNFSPKDVQKRVFEAQLKLACEERKTVLAHEREAHQDFLEIVLKYRDQLPYIVMHCFTGTADEIRTYVSLGFYIGITGYACKSCGKNIRDAITDGSLPLDRILLETDAPYMLPNAPRSELDLTSQFMLNRLRRGDKPRNEPYTLPIVAKTVGRCLGIEAKDVARITTANAVKIFKLKPAL